MNIIHSIVNPLASLVTGSSFATSKANDASAGSNAGSSAAAPSNSLNANSFITLLTTELQAQDPLNPLDPTQFVDQLTSLNSLQQLIQIRQDLDSLNGGATTGTAGGASGTAAAATGNALGAYVANAISKKARASQSPMAAGASVNALSSVQSLLNNSIATSQSAAAALYSKLGAQSKLF